MNRQSFLEPFCDDNPDIALCVNRGSFLPLGSHEDQLCTSFKIGVLSGKWDLEESIYEYMNAQLSLEKSQKPSKVTFKQNLVQWLNK